MEDDVGRAADWITEHHWNDSWPYITDPPNRFKEYRRKHGVTWMQKDGTVLRMEFMTNKHVVHSILLLERAGQESTRAYRGLKKELAKRSLDMLK
jgi:hypothetical protein